MNKVDWSLAPDDAQIYSPEFGDCNAVWYKVDAGKVFCWPIGSYEWSERYKMIGELIYRPKQEPKPWSGPEDGLPSVGIEVNYEGEKCTVVAHVSEGSLQAVILQGDDDWYYSEGGEIQAIKTPEQLSAEEREKSIREVMDIAQVDCRVTAARLVDAGFKREVV